ncbi:CvpA family protein [Hydrogenimonas sp.]
MQTNWFDAVSAVLILFIGLKGLFNGIVRELSGLLGVVAGVWIGSLYARGLGAWLGAHLLRIDSPSALTMVGFLVLLALTWVGFIVLGVVLSKTLTLTELGAADRALGFVFASLKVFIILAVIVYALSSIEFVRKNAERFVEGSHFYPWFMKTGEAIVHIDTEGAVSRSRLLENEAKSYIQKSTGAAAEANTTQKAK